MTGAAQGVGDEPVRPQLLDDLRQKLPSLATPSLCRPDRLLDLLKASSMRRRSGCDSTYWVSGRRIPAATDTPNQLSLRRPEPTPCLMKQLVAGRPVLNRSRSPTGDMVRTSQILLLLVVAGASGDMAWQCGRAVWTSWD